MFDYKKAEFIVSKLTRLTQEKSLRWARTTPASDVGAGTHSRFPYYAEALYDQNVMLAYYEERYRSYIDPEEFKWSEISRLVMMDAMKNILFEFPNTSSLRDLSRAIKEQVTDVESVFSALLSDFDDQKKDNDIPF